MPPLDDRDRSPDDNVDDEAFDDDLDARAIGRLPQVWSPAHKPTVELAPRRVACPGLLSPDCRPKVGFARNADNPWSVGTSEIDSMSAGSNWRPPADSSPSDSSISSHHGQFVPGAKVAKRYRIVSLLGHGGMGEVYRADDLKLGHTVALKFLPKRVAKDARRIEFFHNEVRLARQISHPNVCRVYDIGEVNGQHFLTMEFVDGEDLRGLLKRIGRLPHDKGVEIAQQLCAGLAAAHARGVLHRDLKPANVMVDGRGHVRITDFGLARLAGDKESTEVVGTPAYMAPEQMGRGEATVQSDLYSLGLILYEVFTGKRVRAEATPIDLPEHLEDSSNITSPSQIVQDIDPAVERVIVQCLESDPERRPLSVDSIAKHAARTRSAGKRLGGLAKPRHRRWWQLREVRASALGRPSAWPRWRGSCWLSAPLLCFLAVCISAIVYLLENKRWCWRMTPRN